jgi:hypothetical protein
LRKRRCIAGRKMSVAVVCRSHALSTDCQGWDGGGSHSAAVQGVDSQTCRSIQQSDRSSRRVSCRCRRNGRSESNRLTCIGRVQRGMKNSCGGSRIWERSCIEEHAHNTLFRIGGAAGSIRAQTCCDEIRLASRQISQSQTWNGAIETAHGAKVLHGLKRPVPIA